MSTDVHNYQGGRHGCREVVTDTVDRCPQMCIIIKAADMGVARLCFPVSSFDVVVALGKTHMRSPLSSSRVPNASLETVSMLLFSG